METIKTKIDPSKIMQIGMGFWASKILLTAVELQLFTHLSERALSGREIQERLGLHERNLYDFLDSLTALGFLERVGLKGEAVYQNSEDVNLFLDKNKPSYMGGILEMANNRLYPFWHDLGAGLKTGKPQNETKTGGPSVFDIIYSDQEKLAEFVNAMGGIQMGNFIALAKAFDFSGYDTLCDLGGGGGYLAAQIAIHNPHMQCSTFDLPPLAPVATEIIQSMQQEDQVEVLSGDFFQDEIPTADVITMGNVLHDWGLADKKRLIKKAYNALPEGGALVVIENIIDDERNKNTFGLMMSLNMMIETPDGFDFSFSDFNDWAFEAGFSETTIMPLTGPTSAVIAYK